MIRLLTPLFVALFFMSSAAFAAEVKKGDSFTIGRAYYPRVKNLTPITGYGRSFEYGDECFIRGTDVVEVLGIDRERVLVRFTVTDVEDTSRNSCSLGVIFFLPMREITRMERYSPEEEKELIRRLTQ